MNDSIKRISLDIRSTNYRETVNAKQGDTARRIVISLVDGGVPYIIGEDCYAVFKASKPDGSILYNACTIENNTIIYEFTEQTCAVVGRCRCEIALYGPDDTLITSPRFALLVDGTIYPDGSVESANEFSALTQMVSDTLEVQIATSKATESANTATANATEAAENANKATESAGAATVAANTAALSADASSKTATQAAQSATEAAALAAEKAAIANNNAQFAEEKALAAEAATSSALQAADEATAAADKAIRASYSCLVVGKASGENISLDNASEQYLGGLKIFGKTTQDGTPTPDAPVEMVSAGGGGSITVNVTGENDAQNMTIATPNGLPGIPVATGGNYTDSKGQQWICDEIDFARGVYVKRIEQFSLAVADMNNSESFPGWTHVGIAKYYPESNNTIDVLGSVVLCNMSKTAPYINTLRGNDVMLIPGHTSMTQTEWKAQYPNLVCELIVSIPAPIETPLTEEELAAYADLHTYKEYTVVSNDAPAHMELEYVMDAKKYIDNKISTGILEATVE